MSSNLIIAFNTTYASLKAFLLCTISWMFGSRTFFTITW